MPINYRGKEYDEPKALVTALASDRYVFAENPTPLPPKDYLQKAIDTRENFQESLKFFKKYLKSVHGPVDKKAISVEQGFAAFSDDAPLNAPNIHDCVFIVLADPNSNFSAAMHIDFITSSESIVETVKDFLNRLGVDSKQHQQYQLNCHLMGGNPTTSKFFDKVFTSLKRFNINMLQSNLTMEHDSYTDRPIHFNYDPKTKKFYRAYVPCSNQVRYGGFISTGLIIGKESQRDLKLVACIKADKTSWYPYKFESSQIEEAENSADDDLEGIKSFIHYKYTKTLGKPSTDRTYIEDCATSLLSRLILFDFLSKHIPSQSQPGSKLKRLRVLPLETILYEGDGSKSSILERCGVKA